MLAKVRGLPRVGRDRRRCSWRRDAAGPRRAPVPRCTALAAAHVCAHLPELPIPAAAGHPLLPQQAHSAPRSQASGSPIRPPSAVYCQLLWRPSTHLYVILAPDNRTSSLTEGAASRLPILASRARLTFRSARTPTRYGLRRAVAARPMHHASPCCIFFIALQGGDAVVPRARAAARRVHVHDVRGHLEPRLPLCRWAAGAAPLTRASACRPRAHASLLASPFSPSEMLSGRPLFPGDSQIDMLHRMFR